MNPRVLADAVLVLHSLFIAFAVFGGLPTYKKGQWRKPLLTLHLACAAWARGSFVGQCLVMSRFRCVLRLTRPTCDVSSKWMMERL